MDESEFEHGVDLAVVQRRHDDDLPRLALAQRRADCQIAFRHVLHEDGFGLFGGLAQQAVVQFEPLGRAVAGRHAIGGRTAEIGLLDKEGAGMGVEVISQVAQHVFGELFAALIAGYRLAEADLPGLHPLLPPAILRRSPQQISDA